MFWGSGGSVAQRRGYRMWVPDAPRIPGTFTQTQRKSISDRLRCGKMAESSAESPLPAQRQLGWIAGAVAFGGLLGWIAWAFCDLLLPAAALDPAKWVRTGGGLVGTGAASWVFFNAILP